MTTFIGIRGTAIQALSSDPSNPEVGQIWYNSSSGTLKGYQLVATNAWSSGGNLSSNGTRSTGFGIQTAAIAGDVYLGPLGFSNTFQSYNGSAWTSSPAKNTASNAASGSAGTSQTAGLSFGGQNSPPGTAQNNTESYNGSAWTAVNTLPVAKMYMGGAGTQTAALGFGGYDNTAYVGTTEIWNGTSWTANPTNLNTARPGISGFGTQTAAIAVSGYPVPTNGTKTESFNGTTWTNVNALNTARGHAGCFGIQTAGLVFSGEIAPGGSTNATESWNGTSWTTLPATMATAREDALGVGTQGLGLAVGGYSNPGPPTYTYNTTEEWTGTQLLTKTITVS